VPAAQHHGERAGVDHGGNGLSGPGLPVLERAVRNREYRALAGLLLGAALLSIKLLPIF